MENSRIKICVLGTRGFPGVQGGVETHCENLYTRLADLDCDVTVFTRPGYVNSDLREFRNVRLVPLKCPKNKFLEALLHTFRGVFAARATGCDVLHVHAIGPTFFVPLARLLGMKVVVTNHGPDYDRQKWGKPAKWFLRTAEMFGTLWANSVIAISQTIKNQLSHKFKVNPNLIPNGVILPDTLTTKETLSKFGLTEKKYVIAVGRFVPEKGFHDLIQAFSNLDTDWKLAIVGAADHEDSYSRELKLQAAKNPKIILTGFQKGQALSELFTHSGLFVLPSYHEGLPIVLLEAMSYGLSCILSDIPANREMALQEDRYFKAGDVLGMAEKLEHYMEMDHLPPHEREAQIRRILEDYNWDLIAKRTLNVYRSVL